MALALGRTVEELEKSLSVLELAEWVAFWTIEPFGDDYRQSGQICNVLALVNGNKKSTVEDFMPSARKKDFSSPDEMRAELAKIPSFKKQMDEAGK